MPAPDKKPRTLYDKVFHDHIVDEREDGTVLLYIGKSKHEREGAVQTKLMICRSTSRS